MIISATGMLVLEASERFEKHVAYELGLRDVFKMKYDWLKAHTKYISNEDGSVTIEHVESEEELEYPSKEEVDNYIRKREEYVANEVLKQCGWNEFVKRCKLVGIEDYIDMCLPCQSLDHQCQMFCKRFNNCQGYEVVDYRNMELKRD